MSQHSSLQPNPLLAEYSGEQVKYYYYPVHVQGLIASPLRELLGCYNPQPRRSGDLQASLIKAEKGRYSHVKIPLDRIGDAQIEEVLAVCRQRKMPVVLQVLTSFLHDKAFRQGLRELVSEYEIEWILDHSDSEGHQWIRELSGAAKSAHLSLPIHQQLDWKPIFCAELFSFFKRIHLYFGYQLDLSSPFLNCKQAHYLVGLLRKRFPKFEFLPPRGVDLWDSRVKVDFDMEPFLLPCYQTQSEKPKIRFSVIIPTFNNQNHLRVVLRHLHQQTVGLDAFEVIIVDDGGTDQTQALLMEQVQSFPGAMNFKYLFFPRPRPRVMGDSQYRAGIARNLGAKNAAGEILCFLDSDIVVPADYLQTVGETLQTWDAVQARRQNLSRAASHLQFSYQDLDPSRDLIADEAYWEEFIKTESWHELPFNWKYACTHSFSLRAELFWKVGGLKKNFIFYGFEDTDLGYRLVKSGYRLHLLSTKVYHLFHEDTRSEFMNLKSLRHILLSRTAQIFYLHHLDEDIYSNLLGFMEPEPTLERWLRRLGRLVTLNMVWGRSDQVYRSLQALPRQEQSS